jgi:hypothetical protein
VVVGWIAVFRLLVHQIGSVVIRLDRYRYPLGQLASNPVAVEKVFLGNFNSEIRS